jgi:hypothetical protein
MDEVAWVSSLIPLVQVNLRDHDPTLRALQGSKLPYAHEILLYAESKPKEAQFISYEIDLLIAEFVSPTAWKPRIVIECKLNTVTTHDAITYSHKSLTHKNVHPYLRYGILIGNRRHYPLPGRLFRHGISFDFMQSWQALEPTADELNESIHLIIEEVTVSRSLEEIIFNSRRSKRARYTILHKPLRLR